MSRAILSNRRALSRSRRQARIKFRMKNDTFLRPLKMQREIIVARDGYYFCSMGTVGCLGGALCDLQNQDCHVFPSSFFF